MLTLRLLTVRRVCIQRNRMSQINHKDPCSDCPIYQICSLFSELPINWSESDIENIKSNTNAYYNEKGVKI